MHNVKERTDHTFLFGKTSHVGMARSICKSHETEKYWQTQFLREQFANNLTLSGEGKESKCLSYELKQ